MVEDTPEELLGELFNAAYFPNHPLGRPIEGTKETVSSFDHETTATFHAREFSHPNLVVAAAGNVEHARLVEMVEAALLARRQMAMGFSRAVSIPPLHRLPPF